MLHFETNNGHSCWYITFLWYKANFSIRDKTIQMNNEQFHSNQARIQKIFPGGVQP